MWNPFRRRPVAPPPQPEPLSPEDQERADRFHTWGVTR